MGRDRLISELAARQYGVVGLGQLEALGLSVRVVDWHADAGRLHRVHQGVYAVGHPLLSINGERLAAVMACGPRAVLSHRSAAALWGIRRDNRGRFDVIAPGRRGRIPVGIDAHRDGTLRPRDRAIVDGIPCTSLARTFLDLAATIAPHELGYAVTRAEVLRIFDMGEMEELIARSRGRRGVARLRLAIAGHDPNDQFARRELERLFLRLCRQARLPRPEVNAPLLLSDGPVEADFLWRDARLIVEADGRQTHGTVTAFENDRRRDQRLKLAGWDVIRTTWRQVRHEPEALIQTIGQLLAR